MPARHGSGLQAEQTALDYLREQGLRLVTRNFATRRGEIDLVMRERDALIFVEVRYRASAEYGSAESSITPGKQRRLRAAAEAFLQRHDRQGRRAARFDVVTLSGTLTRPNINWIVDAF